MKTFEEWQNESELSEVNWRKLGHGSALAGSLLGGSLAGLGIANHISPPKAKSKPAVVASAPTKSVSKSVPAPKHKPDPENYKGFVSKGRAEFEVPAKQSEKVPEKAPESVKKTFITDEPKKGGSFKDFVDQSPQTPADNCSYLSYIPVQKYERFVKALENDGGRVEQEEKHGNIVMVWYKAKQKVQFECKTYLVWEAEVPAAHVGFVGDSGVQQHSAGPLYPIMIRGVGNTLQAFAGEDQQGPRHPYRSGASVLSFQQAHDKAERDARTMLAALRAGETDLTANLDYSSDYDSVTKRVTGQNPSKPKMKPVFAQMPPDDPNVPKRATQVTWPKTSGL